MHQCGSLTNKVFKVTNLGAVEREDSNASLGLKRDERNVLSLIITRERIREHVLRLTSYNTRGSLAMEKRFFGLNVARRVTNNHGN